MGESLFSPYWYRVAQLVPRLPAHARLHRHLYRGQVWYVLEDQSSGRHHRLSASAHWICGLMDGERSVQQIWDAVTERFGDDAPTQGESIELLGRLHAANVLLCDVSPDGLELFRRYEADLRQRRRGRFGNPLALRFPLLDPDRALERAVPLLRPLFGRVGAALWIAVVGGAALLAGAHWQELSRDALDRILSAQNLLILGIAFPIVKALHECGHAFATRLQGGEVHEAGIALLVGMPVPYVDASAASAFPRRGQRMLVGAAGMGVELLLAALALFAWLLVEPGFARALAWNVMLIGSVSTLAFNGNPLLRFDGYYVLADALGIPNLAQRSNAHLGWLAQRYLFGLREARSPATAPGEARWFVSYGIAAFVYRMLVAFAIALFLAERFLAVGILIAALALGSQIVLPLLRHVRFVVAGPELRRRRVRAVGVSTALAAGVALFLLAFPLPLRTRAEGVVWLPERSQVRAGSDGFVQSVLAEPHSRVREGDALIETEDPLLRAQVALIEARLVEAQARREAAWGSERVETEILEEKITTLEAELARARERADAGVLRSPTDGVFLLPGAQDLPGRFVRQGELVGWVADFASLTARVVVPQADIALVRADTRAVSVRLADHPERELPARIERQVPSASHRLPSAALGTQGGGRLAVDPSDEQGLTALETVFQFDLAVESAFPARTLGGRVHVLFDHGSEPMAMRSWRGLRRLLLRRIGV